MIRPYRPSKQSVNQPRIGNILDPLGNDKKWTNVWGAVMNVPQSSGGAPVSPTPTPSVTPTMTVTPTPSVTPTSSVTPTPSVTPSITPSITPSSTPPASGTTEANTFLSAVVNAGGTGVTSTVSAATRTLFTSLVSNGLWDKMIAFYPIIGGNAEGCKFNGKNPLNTDNAFRITFNGGWTFDASGATPNGVNSYGETYINESTSMSLDDKHISTYILTNVDGVYCDLGNFNNTNSGTNLFSRLSNEQYLRISDNYGFGNFSVADSSGFIVGSRLSSSSRKTFRNGSQTSNVTISSVSQLNRTMWISAMNNVGVDKYYSPRKFSFVSFGYGLTDSEVSTLSSIINTFQTTLSRNIY
jgi:hypothetical protein